jgi:hypothetical protein
MSKIRMLLGFLLIALAIEAQAAIDTKSAWHQVSAINLGKDLVEAHIGGRAALCSWVDEKPESKDENGVVVTKSEGKTTIVVGVKDNKDTFGIKKLVYSLDKGEPIVTYAQINTKGFTPRSIVRTSNGVLYLTANKGINVAWSEHVSEGMTTDLTSPKSLIGGVWVSVDDGDKWVELKGSDELACTPTTYTIERFRKGAALCN